MTPNSERIEQIRARERKASPGPWIWQNGNSPGGDSIDILMAEVGKAGPDEDPEYAPILSYGDFPESQISDNWEFVAASRDDIPWLLSQLEEAQREIGRLKGAIGKLGYNRMT